MVILPGAPRVSSHFYKASVRISSMVLHKKVLPILLPDLSRYCEIMYKLSVLLILHLWNNGSMNKEEISCQNYA